MRFPTTLLMGPKIIPLACLLCVCLLSSCSATPSAAVSSTPTTMPSGESASVYGQSVAQGRLEADEQVAEGRATIYCFGFSSPPDRDAETGLPNEDIAGCSITMADLGRVSG